MTNEYGKRVYGTCLTVLEEYTPQGDEPWNNHAAAVSSTEGESSIEIGVTKAKFYLPKVLCLMSTWPYLSAFREYLAQLYRLATSTDCMTAPIERHVLNICREIPAPPPGAYEIRVPILSSHIRFWAPPAKLPLAYVALPFQILFECLDIDNVLAVWHGLILERKVLLVSSQQSILAVVSEILLSLLFPLRWSHLYVPLLPRLLCPMLDAPVPYLCGVGRDNWLCAEQSLPPDTMVVDLDHNKITHRLQLPALPVRKFSKLKESLINTALVGEIFWKARGFNREYNFHKHSKTHELLMKQNQKPYTKLYHMDHAFQLAFSPQSDLVSNDTIGHAANSFSQEEAAQSQCDKTQEAFLRFFTALLKDYRRYLNENAFDRISFVASQKNENSPFYVEFTMTQHFDDFISRRIVSPGEPDIIFFDQSIDAKLNRSKLKLRKIDTPMLHSAKAHRSLRHVDALLPFSADLDDNDSVFIYKYDTWPEVFEEALFCEPRPIPAMISAEFDRQAMLVNRLRADIEETVDEDLELFGGECDASPEVASYTTFIFTYSAFVATDWHEMKAQLGGFPSNERIEEVKECESDEIEAVDAPISLAANDIDEDIANRFVEDLTFGLVQNCPEGGRKAITSTLIFVNGNPGNAYTRLVQNTTLQMKKLHKGLVSRDTRTREDLYAAVEESREVAVAQLDLAFETLRSMAHRDLAVDLDAYKSLMEACARCGDSKRATLIMNLITAGGFVADPEIQAIYLSSFVQESAKGISDNHSAMNGQASFESKRKPDAYASYLNKQLKSNGGGESLLNLQCHAFGSSKSIGEDSASLASSVSDDFEKRSSKSGIMDWLSPLNKSPKRRRRKRRDQLVAAMASYNGTDLIQKQLDLAETLLDYLFPDLKIDTAENCPSCSCSLTENDVVDNWAPGSFYDYTTKCTRCQYRFVPKFVVSCSAQNFEGTQGRGTPLYCEFLSPWVLRKTLQPIIKGEDGIHKMVSPEWRNGADIRSTLFWNLIHLCRRYKFPFAFLLQGSFPNTTTVLPRTPSEM